MRAVNLLPREVEKTKSSRLSPPLVTGVVAGVPRRRAARGRLRPRERKRRAQADRARRSARRARAHSRARRAGHRRPRRSQAERDACGSPRCRARSTAASPGTACSARSRSSCPDDVWLSALTLQAPAAAPVVPPTGRPRSRPPVPTTPTTASTDFTMNGKAFSHQGVARLLSRLALVPDLEDVTLGHSTRVQGGARGSVEFTVTAADPRSGSGDAMKREAAQHLADGRRAVLVGVARLRSSCSPASSSSSCRSATRRRSSPRSSRRRRRRS